jgi:hypothetical protein
VLSGVYKQKHLIEVQRRGLTLFWAHDLDKLAEWIAATNPANAKMVADKPRRPRT